MRNILITGGAGFIGSNFIHYWQKKYSNDRIYVIDALTYAGNKSNIDSLIDADEIAFFHGNICDKDFVKEVYKKNKIDVVVHFAAESHVDRSILHPDAFLFTNVIGTHVLLDEALKYWKGGFEGRRFHHISTDEVYGDLGPSDPAFTEVVPYNPHSPYAASKASSDMLVKAYHFTYGLPITISNCSNNYGPYQFPEKLIPLMIINILEGKTLPVYGDGTNIRDWLHVNDHCKGIEKILEFGRNGETYNIGGYTELTNLQLVEELCEQLDIKLRADPKLMKIFPNSLPAIGKESKTLIRFVKDRPGHDRRYAINAEKIEKELGFLPEVDFKTGLASTLQWYLSNIKWWREILSGDYKNWVKTHYGTN